MAKLLWEKYCPQQFTDTKKQRIKGKTNFKRGWKFWKILLFLFFLLICSNGWRRISAKHSDLDRNIPQKKRKQSPLSVARIQKIFRLEHQLADRPERHLGQIEVLSCYQKQQSNCLSWNRGSAVGFPVTKSCHKQLC